jgi:adenylate cyclase
MATIEYANGESFEESDLSLSLLQMSLKNDIQHMHVCGGTARCSTCRVMVLDGLENCLPRNPLEQRLALKKGFDDTIRLACQTRITGDVKLRRLTLDDFDADLACYGQIQSSAREAKLAILFSDIRDFTVFSENRLPYDTIHLLNRYFYLMGNAILQNDGFIDKYIGDGIMALFGINTTDGTRACYNAVSAALQMMQELEKLNYYLKRNFDVEFRIGIGIHYGEVVLGELGHPDRRSVTVIGDSVNTASRIESTTKVVGAPLLVSETVREQLGGQLDVGRSFEQHLKGKSGSHKLYEVLTLFDENLTESPEDKVRRLRMVLLNSIPLQRAPLSLRLAFHDAATYSKKRGSGGMNGSIRFKEELDLPCNAGLEPAVELLKPIKERYPEYSWADVIALAGAVAVERCGGPSIPVPIGRKDAESAAEEGMVPVRDMTAASLKARFVDMGLTPQEMVALSGGHTLGRVDGNPYTDDWLKFTNSYYQSLLAGGDATRHMLPTDRALMEDAECRIYIERYAQDQNAFFEDFARAYRRMTLLGTGLK